MSGFSFATQVSKSYYYNTIELFIADDSRSVLGELTHWAFEANKDQSDAWENQITQLQDKLKTSECTGNIIFEYDIVRLGKRIDVVLLIKHMVFSLEFKNGAKQYLARDAEQAEDYALDLKNFHKESENLYVCPILIATEANAYNNTIGAYADKQVFLQKANSETMMSCIKNVYDRYGTDEEINFDAWYNSQYCPTPTIIEAAVEAYINNTVEEIAHSEAGQNDVDACKDAVNKIVEYSKAHNKKSICFITGVPGAGKTLVGLDLASNNLSVEKNTKAVYLSGNGPLVDVLRQALVNNTIVRKKAKEKIDKKAAKIAVQAFIQAAYQFRKDNLLHPDNEPPENVIIFDEAQRCWDKNKLTDFVKKKMGKDIDMSEPQCFIEIMDRRKDWAVIVCLVGLGQDIYDGEVGINEWFRSAIEDYDGWELYYSDKIFEQLEDKAIDRQLIESSNKSHMVKELHLSTGIRSFRSQRQSEFVDNLLAGNTEKAREIYNEIQDKYPIYITRDINKARDATRKKVRGSQRCGIIACSSAQRLRPYGIFVPTEIDVENWFLAPKEDLRSSNAMEVVASEFKVQGLEIDYSIVCWDADLRRVGDTWDYYSFRGTKWQNRNQPIKQRYLLNAYRVLLTRARQSMIIFVPEGVDEETDPTRKKEYYDGVYNYLHNECGIKEL